MVGKEPCNWDTIKTEADVGAVKDLNAWDDRARPLLYALCKNNCDESVISAAISKGAKLEGVNKSEKTPLFAAVRSANPAIVQLLLDAGASPNHTSKAGQTPLWLACRDGLTEIVSLLVAKDADTGFIEERSQTDPLIVALSEGYEATGMAVLEAANFQVEYQETLGCSPLWVAASAGLVDICKKLLVMGADPNHINEFGRTPIMAAALNGHTNVVEVLLAQSAEATMVDENGENALYMASAEGHPESVRALLAGAMLDVNEANSDGETPLIAACWHGHQNSVKYLTEHGANVDKQNKVGKTPLIAACWRRFPNIVKELLAHGADIHLVDDHGRTPLWAACRSGCPECVQICLEAGADPEQRDQRMSTFDAGAGVISCTPIFAACWEGHAAAVLKMLEMGCSPDDGDDENRLPSEVTDNEEIKGHLKEYHNLRSTGSQPPPPKGAGLWTKLEEAKKKTKNLQEQVDHLKKEKERELAATSKAHTKLQESQQALTQAKEAVATAAKDGSGAEAAEASLKQAQQKYDELKNLEQTRNHKVEEIENQMAKLTQDQEAAQDEYDKLRGKEKKGRERKSSVMSMMMRRATKRLSVKAVVKAVAPDTPDLTKQQAEAAAAALTT